MQDKLVIAGIPPYDGEHEFDIIEFLDSLTNRELHRIKVMSGVRAGELFDAMNAGDSDIVVAMAVLLLERKGRRVDEDRFWDAPADSGITLRLVDREATQNPPTVGPAEPETETLSSNGGESGRTPSGSPPESDQKVIGLRDSARSSTSDLAISPI